MECPNTECKATIEKKLSHHDFTLYGKDGLGGIVSCLKDKISRKTLFGVFLPVLTLLAVFIVYGFNAWGNATDERKGNRLSIELIKKDLEIINKTTQRIEENQLNPKDFLNEIKKIIKEKSNEKNP